MRRVAVLKILVSCMAAFLLLAAGPQSASAQLQLSEFGVATSSGGVFSRQAGAHPDLLTHFALRAKVGSIYPENLNDVQVELPPGLVGNPTAFPKCPASLVVSAVGFANCPVTSVVGSAAVHLAGASNLEIDPIYNVAHGPNTPGLFAFVVKQVPIYLEAKVRPDDYGVTTGSFRTNQTQIVDSVDIEFWGVPADPSHDAKRSIFGAVPSPLPPVPFITSPTSCSGGPKAFTIEANSWEDPVFATARTSVDLEGTPFVFGGCEHLPFEPSAAFEFESHRAGAPTGLKVSISVPQNENPQSVATANVRRTSVTFPSGVAISPSVATGLGACSLAQVGLGTNDPPACPDSSVIGTVGITTPLLEEELTGKVYVAQQKANPFNSNYAIYLVVKGPGFYVKLPGKIDADQQSGQLTATFDNQPQLPYEQVALSLDGGPRAAISSPEMCGTYPVRVEMESWAATKPVVIDSPMKIDEGCSTGAFSPGFKAGTTNPTGGSFSPFTLQVTRNEGEANLSKISATLPPGLLAKIAGVPLCGDAPAASGNCPAGSQVGTTTIGAGAGSNPLYIPEAGKAPTAVYLAGPYRGAPYSLVVRVPAQAGPFDLGTVVVRNALRVDPTTTQVTAESDPLPQILEGIPVSYRDVRVEVNRPEFTLNPTNCSQFQVTSLLTSAVGQSASPKAPFAAANCERLGFKPTLALQMKGQTKRAGNPALTATLKAPAGQANIADTTVILPKTVFIDQRHVSGPCTRVQFAADACPAKSVLGTAVAYSPLLDKPLEGPVYFRSNGGERQLPDIVADLNGQIHVVLVGFIDSKKVGKETSLVRTRFASVPDAPVSKFVLKLKGGKRSLIQNSANLCKVQPKAEVKMTGQNGKTNDFDQKIAVQCGKKPNPKKT